MAQLCCAWLETIGLITGIGTQAYAGSQTLQSIILLSTSFTATIIIVLSVCCFSASSAATCCSNDSTKDWPTSCTERRMKKIIPLLIMGCGGVGRQLIEHIVNTRPLHYSQGIRLGVLGVCDSQSLLMATNAPAAELSDECLKNIYHLKSSGFPLSAVDSVDGFQVFGVHKVIIKLLDIASSSGRSTGLVFVDCSASDETSQLLNELGCCVVLANKRPLTSNIEVYEKMVSNLRHLRCESTVGAGLPVIISLNRLKASGDPVRRIMGALSGTLRYVTSELQGRQSFSEVVRAAKALGFTEPDPRDDLSGMDACKEGFDSSSAAWVANQLGEC